MRAWVALAALCVVSCAPAPALMGEEEAHDTLERFAEGDRDIGHVCEPEGAALMQRAARSYRVAMDAKGQQWPSLDREIARQADKVERYVRALNGFGFLTNQQLRGQRPQWGFSFERGFRLHGEFDITGDAKCREVYDVMHANFEDKLEVDRLNDQLRRANGRDGRRAMRLSRRINMLYARMRERLDNLER